MREGNKCQHSDSLGAHAGTLTTALRDCSKFIAGSSTDVLPEDMWEWYKFDCQHTHKVQCLLLPLHLINYRPRNEKRKERSRGREMSTAEWWQNGGHLPLQKLSCGDFTPTKICMHSY